jgi:hypothetical protein
MHETPAAATNHVTHGQPSRLHQPLASACLSGVQFEMPGGQHALQTGLNNPSPAHSADHMLPTACRCRPTCALLAAVLGGSACLGGTAADPGELGAVGTSHCCCWCYYCYCCLEPAARADPVTSSAAAAAAVVMVAAVVGCRVQNSPERCRVIKERSSMIECVLYFVVHGK